MSEKLTPGQTWDQWVGEQTPDEFMALSGPVSYSTAVDAYLDDLVETNPTFRDLRSEEQDAIAQLLEDYLWQQMTLKPAPEEQP